MNINIVITPKDINFTPSEDSIDEVTEYLEDAVGDSVDFIDISVAPRVIYIDEGDSLLPSIKCPSCEKSIHTNGNHSDWIKNLREALISNEDLDLENHSVTMPCCGKDTPVTSLDFGGKAGFARFSITLEGADINNKKSKIANKVSKIIGTPVLIIELAST